jgi:sterol 3beta-glucosyltransferase
VRILLVTAGSRGDVEPFAALAERALAEGHEVRLVVPRNSGVDTGRLDVVNLDVDYTRMIEEHGVSPVRALQNLRSVVRPVMRGVILGGARAVLEYRPDVLVYHPKVLSAPLVADALGIPHVLVEIVPALTPTSAFPAAGTLRRGIGRFNPLTYRAAGAAAAMFRDDLREVRALVGTAAHASSVPAATLLPISPAILPRPSDWPGTVHLTGPWLRVMEPAALDDPVAEFVAGGPFLYAGFGSMATGDPAARGRAIVGAARSRGTRCLIATGLGGIAVTPGLLGSDVLTVRSAPHARVFPLSSAAVHHGGIGTVQAAMAAGTPSVLVPFIADQPFWGARLHEAGLTPRPIRQRALTAPSLALALDAAEQRRSRVSEVAMAMSAEDGTLSALRILAAVR